MPKNQKKRVTNCDRHNFSLKPRSQYIAQPQYLHVSFCTQPPFATQKQQQPVDTQPCINAPIFNRDNNFATPTFVLTSQQNFDYLEGNRMRAEHERRMINYTDEKYSINIPKPRTKNNYCSVCHQNYNDYLDVSQTFTKHIQSNPHKKRINSSQFNKHILQLTKTFKKYQPLTSPPKRQIKQKIKQIKIEQQEEQESNSVQIISNPNKKIKLNQNQENGMTLIPTRPMNNQRVSYQNLIADQTAAINQRMQSVQETLNFNINMNLFLNQMPISTIPNFVSTSFNPYLDLQYQNFLLQQMHFQPNNQTLFQPSNQPPFNINFQQFPQAPAPQVHQEPQRPKMPLNYIVLDE